MSAELRSHRRIAPLIVLTLILSVIFPLISGSQHTAAEEKPRLKLDDEQAEIGGDVTAKGKYFPVDAEGQLLWEIDQTVLAEFKTDSDGEFKVEFVVPDAQPGTYGVIAVAPEDEEGTVAADSASLDVEAPAEPTIPPTEIPTDTPAPPPATDTAEPDPATDTPEPKADTSTPEPKRTSTSTPEAKGETTSTSETKATERASKTPTEKATKSPESEAMAARLAGDSISFPIRAAFYYPWFPHAWKQGGVYPYTNFTPSAGFYDGADRGVISQHIAAMQYGGIQAGISSWWGIGHHTDVRLPALLAASSGTGFKWTIYHEEESLGNPSVSQIRADLTYLRDTYASDPSYLRIDGKFVVFVYADGGDGCGMADRWKQANTVGAYVVLKVFPGYLNCSSQPESWHQYAPSKAADGQGSYSYAISPGFWLKGQTRRLNRDLPRWEQNVRDMAASGANWQLVVSFNEWGEGTSVESAVEWDSRSGYGDYLDVLHTNGTGVTPDATATTNPTNPTATAKPAVPTATSQPTGKYTLYGSARSTNSVEGKFIWDGNLDSTWQTIDGIAPPTRAVVYVTLGSTLPIGTIRWMFGTADIADSMIIQVSDDKLTWTDVHTAGNAPVGQWQQQNFNNLAAKYIRWYFANPNLDPVIGGLAEVEIYAPGAFEGSDDPTPTKTRTPGATRTATPRATSTPGPRTGDVIVAPVADARVEESSPGTNFGSSTTMSVDGGTGTRERTYIRFDVSGLSGSVGSAKLRLYVRSGTKTAPKVYRTSSSWTESSITWNNRPGVSGGTTAGSGALNDGTWIELDVTGLVTGNGTVTLALVATSLDGVTFASRNDSSRKPQLILRQGTAPRPTATSTTPKPTATSTPPRPTATSTTPKPTATSTTPRPTATGIVEAGEAVLLAAGDIADCASSGDEATAKLLAQNSGTIATLGDHVYTDGTTTNFANCFNPSWGKYKSRIRPSPGNHDYHVSGASGYFNYFGSAAGTPGAGYYSYNLGGWHIVVLNSNCSKIGGCGASSPQGKWLQNDLNANSNSCTLAYWHHALFSSGNHGNDSATRELWDILYKKGADVVLMGHDHHYERFAPQTASGASDSRYGIRGFIVGTGGKNLYSLGSTKSNSEIRYNKGFGLLKLTLSSGAYSWQYLSVEGKTFTDSGSGKCHGAPGTASVETDVVAMASVVSPGQLASVAPGIASVSITEDYRSLGPVAQTARRTRVRRVLKRLAPSGSAGVPPQRGRRRSHRYSNLR